MAYLEAFYDDMLSAIVSTWPEVSADGVWQGEHVHMVPWAELTPPFAAIVLPELDKASGWGAANQMYKGTAEIYYVGEIDGDSDVIRAKLEAFRDALYANILTAAQVLRVTRLSWSRDLAVNVVLISKNYTHRAGKLDVEILIGSVIV